MKTHRFTAKLIFILNISCMISMAMAQSDNIKQQARQILDATGIKGGLIVHLECGDGRLTSALRANDSYIVHGLDTDPDQVHQARRTIQSLGTYGNVVVDRFDGINLPYVDNLVNLLIAEHLGDVPMSEVMRILSPNGVLYTKKDGQWYKTIKPWPEDIDEWTHFLHGPDNNAVAEDTQVAPPRHLQWTVGPRWGRSHDHLASMSAAVSASGRLFYIMDEGSIASVMEPSQWMLVARDAFSGVLLWKKKIGPWEDQLRPFRSGPAELPRRLVAVGQRVYVTLGYGKPVTALDAATGDEIRTYEGTENTHEILYYQKKLYFVISDPLSKEHAEESQTTGRIVRRLSPWRDFYDRYVTEYMSKHIRCVQADTGELLWDKNDEDTQHVMPMTLAADDGRMFFENEKEILALNAETGKFLWRVARPIAFHRYAWSSPTLVVQDGVVLSADRSPDANLETGGSDTSKLEWLVTANHLLTNGQIMAFSAQSGEKLWTASCHEGFNFPVDVFVAQGKVWSGELAWARQPGILKVYNLHTGQVVDERPPDQECYTLGFGHARCYRNKATTQYVIHGRSGVEFLDMSSNRIIADHWIRGTCQYGILPCNGLVYVPPHSCACYITAKLNSFNALAPARQSSENRHQTLERLEKGQAYNQIINQQSKIINDNDWPTYRHDNHRSGAIDSLLSSQLTPGWKKQFTGPLTSIVAANGRLFFAQKDAHTIYALNTSDGSALWQYTTGGRVDSPPTIHNGFVYFGSADGWVYCVRATDGTLAWRFRAAQDSQQVVSYNQLESVWPVHGNVLIHQEPNSTPELYVVAGRSSFLDGGLYLCRLDARTGELLSERCISHRDPESGLQPQDTVKGVNMPGALPDILTTDGSSIFMRHLRFDMQGKPLPEDVEHLYGSVGFLDDSWWHRTYWQLGTKMLGGYGGWGQVGNRRISGRMLVVKPDRVFGFGRKGYGITGSHVGLNSEYHLFSADMKLIQPKPRKDKRGKMRRPPTQVRYHWSRGVPFFARAMSLAGETLFVAGPSAISDITAAKPKKNVWLWAVSSTDGTKLAEYKLDASPVFDSFAVFNNCLYFTDMKGRVLAYQARN